MRLSHARVGSRETCIFTKIQFVEDDREVLPRLIGLAQRQVLGIVGKVGHGARIVG